MTLSSLSQTMAVLHQERMSASNISPSAFIVIAAEISPEDSAWVYDPSLPNNGPKVNTAVWCLFAFATIFLGLRVYCKFRRNRGLWWDDYVLIASWVSLFSAAIESSG